MKQRIAIVGAGLAGLSAAYKLRHQPALEITIFEARARVGGRVHSININNQAIDMGGFIIYPWYTTYHQPQHEQLIL
jgi:protoporphyrinogen oxidase